MAERHNKYYEANRESISAKRRAQYEANREVILARNKAWHNVEVLP